MNYDPTDEKLAQEQGWSIDQLKRIQSRLTLSNARIAELSESETINILRKLALSDRPRLRAEYQGLFERGDHGDGSNHTMQFHDSLPTSASSLGSLGFSFALSVSSSASSSFSWRRSQSQARNRTIANTMRMTVGQGMG